MTPLDNLRRIVAGWRGEWRVDAHEGITLSHDGDEWPIASMDGDATIVLVELLNAIRPAVDGATAEIERLTAEMAQAARAFGLVDRERAEAAACREDARAALLNVGIALGVDVPPLDEIEPVRANWQRYAAATVAAAKATAAARAVPPDVGDFIEGHAKRLCDAAGGVWHDEYDSWADVLNHLRADADGTVIDGRASKPATVGGLLATVDRCGVCAQVTANQNHESVGAGLPMEPTCDACLAPEHRPEVPDVR